MSIFGSIMQKIFHHEQATAPDSAAGAPAAVADSAGSGATVAATSSAPTAVAPEPAAASTTAPTPAPSVDVGAVLARMASAKGGGGNYATSIVDLLKLLDLDSSLDARKTLAEELGVHAGADGSAEENIALHKAVMRKLAENGGTVPDSLKG